MQFRFTCSGTFIRCTFHTVPISSFLFPAFSPSFFLLCNQTTLTRASDGFYLSLLFLPPAVSIESHFRYCEASFNFLSLRRWRALHRVHFHASYSHTVIHARVVIFLNPCEWSLGHFFFAIFHWHCKLRLAVSCSARTHARTARQSANSVSVSTEGTPGHAGLAVCSVSRGALKND